ncbi:hypothetical protein BDN72DRAFT_898502 [Pluteus cervinus]|uniref:Uncharacterized protein n=1 Tax=Pluteus cervinus TaxID=181527 RepID=A0ACD3AR32_9AGAR|nr:hypothetical protein BDN72DRAFT_898502 [Pluteus cervinus]
MPAEQATPNIHHGTPGPPDATLAILLDSSCAGGLRQNSASFSASDGDEYKDIRSVTREISSANPAIGSYSVEWLGSETYGESHQASLHSESSSAPKRSLPDENSSTSRANKRRCLVVLPSPDCTARPTTKDQDHAQTLQVVSSQVNNERSPLKDISAATTMSPGAMAVKMDGSR